MQNVTAPLAHAFYEVGLPSVGSIVTIGALFGLSTSLFGTMFPLPRVLYAMASDGLIPRQLAMVHHRFQTPLLATLLAGLVAGLMALVFDLGQLVDMMSIGTLIAYTMVAVCILILRYQDNSVHNRDTKRRAYSLLSTQDDADEGKELVDHIFPEQPSLFNNESPTITEYMKQLVNLSSLTNPTSLSSKVASDNIIVFSVLCIPYSILIVRIASTLSIVGLVFSTIVMILPLVFVHRQPQAQGKTTFRVPGVPWLPGACILINVFLTTQLSINTWARFAIWMTIGFLIYGFYGWRNSSEEYRMKGHLPPGQV